METARSFNEGDVWAKEKLSAHNTTPTTLEQLARSAFQEGNEARPGHQGRLHERDGRESTAPSLPGEASTRDARPDGRVCPSTPPLMRAR
jgi:hypothetical protein